jgi:molecular chaperone GrpE
VTDKEKKANEKEKSSRQDQSINDAADRESGVNVKALDAVVAEAEDLRQKLLRWQADFDNLRRRSAKDVLDAGRTAEGNFARDMLDVLDHFESALSVDPSKTDAASLLQGVKITYDELTKVLQRRGIRSFDPTGEVFDPHRHEAIAQQVAPDKAPGTIIQTLQRGYMFGDKILRPAKVMVSAPAK